MLISFNCCFKFNSNTLCKADRVRVRVRVRVWVRLRVWVRMRVRVKAN